MAYSRFYVFYHRRLRLGYRRRTRCLGVALVGLWAGFVLVNIAFRFFGWGEFAANLLWGAALTVAVPLVFVASRFLFGTIPTFPMWVEVAWRFCLALGSPLGR